MEKEVQTMADMLKVNQMFFEICVTELMTNWQQYKTMPVFSVLCH